MFFIEEMPWNPSLYYFCFGKKNPKTNQTNKPKKFCLHGYALRRLYKIRGFLLFILPDLFFHQAIISAGIFSQPLVRTE